MAKKVTGMIKLQLPAGKATPAPPVGPALGSTGINIMQFTKEFNEKTASQPGMIIPVVITVYQDKSFSFITKVPPVAVLIKKAINPTNIIATNAKINVLYFLKNLSLFTKFSKNFSSLLSSVLT